MFRFQAQQEDTHKVLVRGPNRQMIPARPRRVGACQSQLPA